MLIRAIIRRQKRVGTWATKKKKSRANWGFKPLCIRIWKNIQAEYDIWLSQSTHPLTRIRMHSQHWSTNCEMRRESLHSYVCMHTLFAHIHGVDENFPAFHEDGIILITFNETSNFVFYIVLFHIRLFDLRENVKFRAVSKTSFDIILQRFDLHIKLNKSPSTLNLLPATFISHWRIKGRRKSLEGSQKKPLRLLVKCYFRRGKEPSLYYCE